MSLFSRKTASESTVKSSFNNGYSCTVERIEQKLAMGTLPDGTKVPVGETVLIDIKLPNGKIKEIEPIKFWYRPKNDDGTYGEKKALDGAGLFNEIVFTAIDMGFNPADVEYISDMPYSYKEWDNDTRQMVDRKKDVPQYSKLLAFLKTHKIGFVVVMRTKLKSMAVNGYDLSMYDSINDAFNDVESVWIPDAENEKRKFLYEIHAVYNPETGLNINEKDNGVDEKKGLFKDQQIAYWATKSDDELLKKPMAITSDNILKALKRNLKIAGLEFDESRVDHSDIADLQPSKSTTTATPEAIAEEFDV